LPTPESDKLAVKVQLYSVGWVLNFVSHVTTSKLHLRSTDNATILLCACARAHCSADTEHHQAQFRVTPVCTENPIRIDWGRE
jgi:hypothetical protein